MAVEKIQVPGDVAIKTHVGEVCLQWARLEMALLRLICQIEPMEWEKACIVFGGLDMRPRANMAINLARHNKVPMPFIKRITAVRKVIGEKLDDRRNQAVHGAHRDVEGAETTLTMVRWRGDKRHKRLSSDDLYTLALEIHDVGSEVWSIADDMLLRSLRNHMQKDLGDPLG